MSERTAFQETPACWMPLSRSADLGCGISRHPARAYDNGYHVCKGRVPQAENPFARKGRLATLVFRRGCRDTFWTGNLTQLLQNWLAHSESRECKFRHAQVFAIPPGQWGVGETWVTGACSLPKAPQRRARREGRGRGPPFRGRPSPAP